MSPEVTDNDKLKYWIDSEFTIIHIMFYIVIWLLTHNLFLHILLAVLIVYSVLYMSARIMYILSKDKDYLKVPK